MERDFNNDEFELFLKQKADQHKLYPSDKAWKGIYNTLHPGMRWFKIGGSLLVVTALIFIFQETSFLNSSDSSTKPRATQNSALSPAFNSNQTPKDPVASLQNRTARIQDKATNTNQDKATNTNIATGRIAIADNAATSSQASNSSLAAISEFKNKANNAGEVPNNLKGFILHNEVVNQHSPISINIPSLHTVTAQQAQQTEDKDFVATTKDLAGSMVTMNTVGENGDMPSVKDYNWLQELAAIKLTPQKKSRFNLQFYFSPTISYRRLVDNQNASRANLLNIPIAASRDQNINRYVDQNPSIGAELGSNILFSAGRNFTIKSGLQLNYSRYTIKAFKFYTEKASIALNTAGPVADTISSYTSLRNFNGYFPEQLQNQYLQVSVPVGAELKLIGNKRLQFSVAGTIQPTFLLFSDTYLLSSNYLNYTKEPSLVRKWNVHSSFEAFLSYKTGGLRWQLGPQFRYQLMSSYNDRYPIKEYLFEYGVKIGVSKTLR